MNAVEKKQRIVGNIATAGNDRWDARVIDGIAGIIVIEIASAGIVPKDTVSHNAAVWARAVDTIVLKGVVLDRAVDKRAAVCPPASCRRKAEASARRVSTH